MKGKCNLGESSPNNFCQDMTDVDIKSRWGKLVIGGVREVLPQPLVSCKLPVHRPIFLLLPLPVTAQPQLQKLDFLFEISSLQDEDSFRPPNVYGRGSS